ncbi:MAG: DUF3291 domain-containing protein [Pyrinomonadaceae bacterium]
MENHQYHLAQLNIARMRAPMEDTVMQGFVSQLEAIYAVAESASGFVWRLKAEDFISSPVRAAGDARLIVTMSVWESVEALHDYVYGSAHMNPLRNRGEWFEKIDGPGMALWWIPQNSLPRVEQGMARLKYLQRHGPTAFAFTFNERFPPPVKSV